jgi:diguanylate cyclase (GGDEF)-like protein
MDVGAALQAYQQTLTQRWQTALARAGPDQGGAFAALDLPTLAAVTAALTAYLADGDVVALRRALVAQLGQLSDLHLATTLRGLLVFRRVAESVLVEADDVDLEPLPIREALQRLVDQSSLTLAEIFQTWSADRFAAQAARIAELEERLAVMLPRDPVTGLFTRAFFRERLNAEWRIASRYRRPLSVIVVAVDRFEALKGFEGGAQVSPVLRAIADTLVVSVRSADLVARIAADRFAMVLAETDGIGANALAERLCERVRTLPTEIARETWWPAVSVGVADYRERMPSAETLLRRAEAAMNQARQAGGDQVVWDSNGSA